MIARPPAVTPFDRILEVVQNAGTVHARRLLRHISEEIEDPDDVPRWASAIQLARDVGAVGATECCALLDIVTEYAMQSLTETDADLYRLGEEMRLIQKANGLSDDEDYRLDEAPADWLELNRQWEHRFDQLRSDLFRRIGEPGMADELLLSPETFEARSEEGRSALFNIAGDDRRVWRRSE